MLIISSERIEEERRREEEEAAALALEEQKKREVALAARPPVENVLNLHEFEIITKAVIPEKAWVRSAKVVYDVTLTLSIFQGILLLCIR